MKVVALTGGVGGAKFVLGLQNIEVIDELTCVVNTGDDFRHLGLHISPDIDTLLYTLSGQANVAQGWGREGESWNFMTALKSLGGPDWFNLGDGDLALHILRSEYIAAGKRLDEITSGIAKAWGIKANILPMSNEAVSTWLETDEGLLPFQSYFVERQCRPAVSAIRFEGAAQAKAAPGVVEAIIQADAVFIAPSNPWLSVDPILAVPDIVTAIDETFAPVIAISPLIGGKAVKGPTTKLMAELGVDADNQAIVDHYSGLIDGLIYDDADAGPSALPARATQTLMISLDDKIRVVKAAIAFAREFRA